METSQEIKQTVKQKYNQLAQTKQNCCATADCSNVGESYESLDGYVQEADLGLGCGLPTEFAAIKPGDTVVDLGSGAGNDCFIALRETGSQGHVIGIDMAESMIERARENAEKLGAENVEFKLGEIENIPLTNDSVDVVVSNCVFNLVPDKPNAFAETFRILKPGAHFSISDIVILGQIPDELKKAAELYVGCVSGAMPKDEYLQVIRDAGFEEIRLQKEREIELTNQLLDEFLDPLSKAKFLKSNIGIYSVTVSATKPSACCEPGCCDG